MDSPVRVLLVGYGFAGQTFHAPVISAVPGLELVGVASSQPQKVQADWPKVWVNPLAEESIQQPGVDLVVIATPNQTHFSLAKQALLAGKHVVVDKPLTLSLAEAEELVALAKERGLLLSVYQNRRWDADFLSLKKLLETQTLGEVVHFESHFSRYRPEVRQRWREQDGPGSGLWYDLGPHLADQALQLFGPPLAIFADLELQRQGAQAVDYCHVLLRYPKLRVILHASALVAGGNPRFVVHGTQGSYLKHGLDTQEDALKRSEKPGSVGWGLDPLEGTLYRPDQPPQALPNRPGDYRKYYEGIRDALLHGADNPVSPEQALQVMKALELGLKSTAEKREILWEEART